MPNNHALTALGWCSILLVHALAGCAQQGPLGGPLFANVANVVGLHDIEATRVILGHTSAAVTEIYAEMGRQKAAEIMGIVG